MTDFSLMKFNKHKRGFTNPNLQKVFVKVFVKLAKLLHGMDSGKPLMNNECLWDKTQKAIKLHKYYNILGVNS